MRDPRPAPKLTAGPAAAWTPTDSAVGALARLLRTLAAAQGTKAATETAPTYSLGGRLRTHRYGLLTPPKHHQPEAVTSG